ncbi:hypothetical protein K9L16_02845 [Candidatus Pacearchaeota archaeon]|nr:hypothetical protein [Candidatus Pacearchaeota archaeon]
MKNEKIIFFILLLIFIFPNASSLIEISDCLGIQNMRDNLSEDYVILNDIDCSKSSDFNSGKGFDPIASFKGTLDGKNHTIYNFKIERYNKPSALFTNLCGSSIVRNINFENAVIIAGYGDGGVLVGGSDCSPRDKILIENIFVKNGSVYGGDYEYSGGLIGRVLTGVTLVNCHYQGFVEGAGGLVGQNDGAIINSSFIGSVDGAKTGSWVEAGPEYLPGVTGGFTGWNFGTIRGSFSEGEVSGLNNVGGFVGGNEYLSETWRGEIFDSYSKSNVTALDYKGGFVGYNVGGDIIDSYSTGVVSSNTELSGFGLNLNLFNFRDILPILELDKTGGFLAYIENYECYDGYWNVETSGVSTSACAVNGKTTQEMKTSLTFDSWNKDIWILQNGKYPCFEWQDDCLIPDSDSDGIPDSDDKCPQTSEDEDEIIYGCSCSQILELKPGEDSYEGKKSCPQGVIWIFTKGIGWAKDLF